MIDVYRKDTKAERNLLRYALFVSFFPQLVAGPIERSKNLLKQMKNIESMFLWNTKRMASGSILMVWGYFQKMVIADRVAVLVNTVFDNYHMYGSTELCVAVIGFALQFYCDFGSYSLIAIGAAKIMGFELMENFNTPYFASNWNFVIWGGLHGLYQTAADFTLPYRKKAYDKLNVKTNCFSWHFLQVAVTFLLVDFAWIFFRSKSIKDAIYFIQRIAIRPTPWVLFNGGIYNLGLDRVEMNILIVSLVLLFLVDKIRYKKKMTLDVFLMEQNLLFEWLIIILLVLAIFIFGEYGTTFNAQQFIYFQF